MSQILMAIAMLCQVNVDVNRDYADKKQLSCQQEYIQCYQKAIKNKLDLDSCVLIRELK